MGRSRSKIEVDPPLVISLGEVVDCFSAKKVEWCHAGLVEDSPWYKSGIRICTYQVSSGVYLLDPGSSPG